MTAGRIAGFLSAFMAAATMNASAQTTTSDFAEASLIVRGLENPWGLDFLPDGSALVTERAGRMRLVTGSRISEPLAGVPDVWANGQGGLLDVLVSPAFANDQTIFFSFSEPGDGGAGTAVARARLVRDAGAARLEEVETIFSMSRKSARGQHFGSRLVFAPDGTLFVTTGDRGERDRAQDMQDHAGSVIRIRTDGSVPADNPSPDGSAHLPEIWSKGHRNAQGAVFDTLTGGLLTVEHGARGGDEINKAEAGKNYGWPVVTYRVDYSGARIGSGTAAEGFEPPLHYWDPSIAPSGMVAYSGNMFPEWKDDLLIGSLKFAYLSRLDRDPQGRILGEEKLFDGEFGRIRDVNLAPDGSLWLLTDESDGAIVRVSRGD